MVPENNLQKTTNFRRKLTPIAGLLVVLILAVAIFMFVQNGQTPATSGNITIGSAVRQDLTGQVNITGVLDANGKTSLSSQISGVVAEVRIQEGSKVKQGDVLASLDKKDLQEQFNQAQINLQKAQYAADQAKIAYDQAQADYERSQKLFAGNVLSQSDFEQITQKRDLCKSQYDTAQNTGVPAAQVALTQAQLALNKADLISPIDGTVATCSINPGDFINANTTGPVITIVSDDKMTFAGNVNEDAINWLKLGQKADVQIDSLPGINTQGEISYLGAESIPTGQFFPIKIKLLNPNSQLKPGMTASATIHIDSPNVVTVPKTAVFRRNGQTCVFVVKDKKAVQTRIVVGLQGDKSVAVDQGLSGGEQIVADGTDAVIDGMTLPTATH
jgi:RND family efflux transporter MFP subunit